MKNKVIITGASGGIGTAICDKYFEKNYELILISSSENKIDLLREKYGKNNFYYKVDLSNNIDVDNQLSELAKSHKDISAIVNNAGITEDSLLLRMSQEKWDKVINTNLTSNFKLIKFLLPNMIANRYGKIVGISSVVATTGNPGQSNYVASKSGMIGLYKSIAHEVAKRNINVNIVSPGFITTAMTNKLNDMQKEKILEQIPMQKFGNPYDIANMVFFLTSKEADYITGQNFNVNGGMLMF